MRIQRVLLSILIFCAMAGCGSIPPTEGPVPLHSQIPPSEASSVNTPENPVKLSDTPEITEMPILPTDPVAQNPVDQAKKDLAQKLNIEETQINLVEATPVVWPDSSLGCPQKGMAYAEVLTPGYLILLEYGGTTYEYHASQGGTVVTCKNPSPPVLATPGNT